jgi:hypothetical protein
LDWLQEVAHLPGLALWIGGVEMIKKVSISFVTQSTGIVHHVVPFASKMFKALDMVCLSLV